MDTAEKTTAAVSTTIQVRGTNNIDAITGASSKHHRYWFAPALCGNSLALSGLFILDTTLLGYSRQY
jgi:hypothetical protein